MEHIFRDLITRFGNTHLVTKPDLIVQIPSNRLQNPGNSFVEFQKYFDNNTTPPIPTPTPIPISTPTFKPIYNKDKSLTQEIIRNEYSL
ncbi:MAG TPA: hypothetical protein DCP90_01155 [Clostridiales bacterium]|nr:MAG: hypothetical protein A2Y22_08105 [Clostridiales bacterium GWD2_32_59]HAN09205.1 hypothetical protein [Clostridiales bacterium]